MHGWSPVGVQNISMNGMEVCLNPLSKVATGANLHGFVLSKTGAQHGMVCAALHSQSQRLYL